MYLRRQVHVLLTAAVLVAQPAAAQLAVLQPGATIRIPGGTQYVLVHRAADTLYLVTKSGIPVAMPLKGLQALEVRGAKDRTAGAVRGASWGGAVGVITGVALWMSGDSTGCHGSEGTGLQSHAVDCDRTYNAGDALGSAAGGALLGAGIGALFGRRQWVALRLDGPSVEALPGRRLVFQFRRR